MELLASVIRDSGLGRTILACRQIRQKCLVKSNMVSFAVGAEEVVGAENLDEVDEDAVVTELAELACLSTCSEELARLNNAGTRHKATDKIFMIPVFDFGT